MNCRFLERGHMCAVVAKTKEEQSVKKWLCAWTGKDCSRREEARPLEECPHFKPLGENFPVR